jgi:hypothetical protein
MAPDGRPIPRKGRVFRYPERTAIRRVAEPEKGGVGHKSAVNRHVVIEKLRRIGGHGILET